MQALAGCTHCGYVEPARSQGAANRACPQFGFPLRELMTARMLRRDRGDARRLRARVREQMSRLRP